MNKMQKPIKLLKLSLLIAGFSLSVASAQASIIFSAGVPTYSADGADLRAGFSEYQWMTGYDERQNVTITSSVAVDYLVGSNAFYGDQLAGVNDTAGNHELLAPGTYSSHLLHFDPVGADGVIEGGVFQFDSDIVAIIASTGGSGNLLSLSDSAFGFSTTLYESYFSRRTENDDFFTLMSPNEINIDYFATAAGNIDNLRIITAGAVPASQPAILSLMLLTLSMGGFSRLRKTK